MQDALCATCNGTGHTTTDLPTEWYFLWLIRLLFFIIELLPTVVKIVMPIGAYDRMIYAEEKDMEKYLTSSTYLDRIRNMHDMELKNHEEQLRAQKEAEQEIRKKLIEEMKDAQWKIAEAAVKNRKRLNFKSQKLPQNREQQYFLNQMMHVERNLSYKNKCSMGNKPSFRIPGLSFSWKRALGITKQNKISVEKLEISF